MKKTRHVIVQQKPECRGKKKMNESLNGMVMRSVQGTGGGAEKIILRTGSLIDSAQCQLKIYSIRHAYDADYDFNECCRSRELCHCEILQTSRFNNHVYRQLLDEVEASPPDFIHAHDYKSVYFARKIGMRYGIPTIATLHGWTGHSRKERYLYYPMERRLLRSFDRVLAVSSQIRDTYLRSGGDPEKVHVILNGIDPDEFTQNSSLRDKAREQLNLNVHEDDLLLIGLGRLERQKRFDISLEAARRLRKAGQPCRLVIAGEGSQKSRLLHQITTQGLENYCHLIGHCEDVRSLYHAADILVQSSDYEGTPTVVVEAMAMQVPVVATDAGGTAELIDDSVHGRIVPCRDPQSLADAIMQTWNHRDTTAQYVFAARQRAENELSFASRTEQLLTHYKEIASPSRIAPAAARCATPQQLSNTNSLPHTHQTKCR